jgi:beta-lactamase regulating signal transducer with metallopeptidase domain
MTALVTVGWVVVHSTWQAVVVAGVLALFLRFGRAPAHLRYATAFGALLTLVVLALVTAVALAVDGARAAIAPAAVVSPSPASALRTGTSALLSVHAAVAPAAKWIAVAWLAAVALLLVRWGGGWWLVARLRGRGTRPARRAWEEALASAAMRTGVTSPVTLLESECVDTPVVVGHRRPVMLLPLPAFEALGRAEAESVLAHELAHVRRADFVANGVQTLVEILFFFHPAVRWVSRVVREERELCCDDVAAELTGGDRVSYADALVAMEALRGPAPGFEVGLTWLIVTV